ncbi:MAG: hypothetical protein ACOX7B_03445 [Christensenellales bacterium]|jgi:hypothetical protein
MGLPLWAEYTVAAAAVLGFLMSLLLTIRQIRDAMVRISLSDGGYYALEDRTWIIIRMTVSNQSSQAISLCSMALKAADGAAYPCSVDSFQIIGTRPSKADHGYEAVSDPLPVYLSSGQACRLLLAFPCPHTAHQSLGLLEALPLATVAKGAPLPYEQPDKVNFQLVIQTQKAKVQGSLSCERKSMRKLLDKISADAIFRR